MFGFDEAYRERDPSIRIVDGSYEPGHGLLSAEAARALGVGVGDVVQLRVPGRAAPLAVPISGITDLTQAKSLFYSRQGQQLEQFVYLRNSLVVGPEVFAASIVPAFQNATTTGGRTIRSQPILEVDVAVEREPLDADPGTALAQTTAIGRAVTDIAPGQDTLIDNISNALMVARDDARVAKRMFVFLGLPGALLAAILTSYAGGVLAGALRREQAILRIRGANRRDLLRMHALRSLILAASGSLLGVGPRAGLGRGGAVRGRSGPGLDGEPARLGRAECRMRIRGHRRGAVRRRPRRDPPADQRGAGPTGLPPAAVAAVLAGRADPGAAGGLRPPGAGARAPSKASAVRCTTAGRCPFGSVW